MVVVDAPTAPGAATTVRRVRRLLDDAAANLAGARVLALCSGGADSVALVALLAALPRGAAPRSIDVLWLDHGLRPDTSDERAAARAVAELIGATLHERTCHADLADDPAGTEAAARTWRYATAARLAHELGADMVATGHTASDQLEQALLALVGVTGRPGAPDSLPVRTALPTDAAGSVQLVRPLLALERAQVEAYLRERGIAWGHDPSNDDPAAHARNHVRHEVVPRLLELHPGAGASLHRAGERRRASALATRELATALLEAWGDDELLDVRDLARVGPDARAEVVAAWLARHAPRSRDLGSRIVSAVVSLALHPARGACASARVDLPGGACVRRDGYHLRITIAHPPERPAP